MQTLYKSLLFMVLLLPVAFGCNNDNDVVLDDTTSGNKTTDATEEDKNTNNSNDIKAELLSWKAFIDKNEKKALKVDSMGYSCEGWGGHVKFIKDNGNMRALEYLTAGEHGHDIKKYYYNEEGEVVVVYHEHGEWIMDTDHIIQVTYLFDDGELFLAKQKEAKGKASQIQKILAETEPMEAPTDRLSKIMDTHDEIAALTPDPQKVQAYFCN